MDGPRLYSQVDHLSAVRGTLRASSLPGGVRGITAPRGSPRGGADKATQAVLSRWDDIRPRRAGSGKSTPNALQKTYFKPGLLPKRNCSFKKGNLENDISNNPDEHSDGTAAWEEALSGAGC